jgi:uncharacterized membrane protein YqaE (UPF0057 family)
MSTADPLNITVDNPNDLQYVSKKNWARKHNVENGKQINNMFGKPGVITGIVLTLFDMLLEILLKFIFYIWDITNYAYTWASKMIFGNFKGLIPSTYSSGMVITLRFFRYIMNVLLPPFGIMLSKGIYGWFSILVCVLLTYISYLAGIIYAFVITSRNRYADQYEDYQLKKNQITYPDAKAVEDITALVSSSGFILLLIVIFYLFFSFF